MPKLFAGQFSVVGLRLFLLAGLWLVLVTPAAADTPCNAPGNLTYNCRLDNFVDRSQGGSIKHIPDGWWFFVLDGDPEMQPSIDTLWGAPSQEIWSDGTPFTAGIYQQVKVTPGVVYKTNIGWAAPTKPDFERKLGLDPNGGTDPQAPSVVWGPSSWEVTAMPNLTASARAAGDTMTVFVWVRHSTSHGIDQVFLDDIGLWPDPDQPAATVTPRPPTATPTPKPPTATPTPKPPTATASPIPATVTPLPSPTLPASPTPQASATTEPTPTTVEPPTPTETPTLSPTPTQPPPTSTSTPTATATLTPIPVVQVVPSPPLTQPEPTAGKGLLLGVLLLLIAGAALTVAVILVSIVVVLWRNRQP